MADLSSGVIHATFYRLALLVPVLVPVLLWAFPVLSAGEATAFFLYSTLATGASYLVFALAIAWWIEGRPAPSVRRLALRAPMLYLPLAWLELAVRDVMAGRPGESLHPATMVFIGASVLLVGYVYVGLVEAARWAALRAGLLHQERPA